MVRRENALFLVALVFSVIILVYPTSASVPPVAAFTYSPTAPIFGQTIIFDASTSYDPDGGTISSYKWDLGDGTNFTIDEPVIFHNYAAFGIYNITLTVTDDEAETNMTWQTVTVREYPVAVFTYSPVSPIVGESVTFNASLSTPEGGTIISYNWDFGDGNVTSSGSPIIAHVYTAFGTHNVTLTVTDSENLIDIASAPILVRDYPTAAFTSSPERPLMNETVTFDASLSTPEGGTITSYEWDFGDGTNGTGVITGHAYATTGDYNVTLTIADDENLADTAWAVVTVIKHPVALFLYTPSLPLVNETVNFDASLSVPNGGTIVSYKWDFGDGSLPVTEADPETTHAYNASGTYTVILNVTDSENLTDTAQAYIRILIAPVANFTHLPVKPIIDEIVTFNAVDSYDPDRSIVSYRWDFGDGNVTVAGQIITHAYEAEGTYDVNLTVTDDDGLTDTVSKLITVYTFLYVHDVAVTNVTTSVTVAYAGQIVDITVVAKNVGTAVESFSVTVYYNTTSIGTEPVINLLPGSETTVPFSWNTSGVTLGHYVMSAQASEVAGETETTDNTLIDGSVVVSARGDVNGDDQIDILDVKLVKLAYSGLIDRPSADLDNNGIINILDVKLMKLIYSGLL